MDQIGPNQEDPRKIKPVFWLKFSYSSVLFADFWTPGVTELDNKIARCDEARQGGKLKKKIALPLLNWLVFTIHVVSCSHWHPSFTFTFIYFHGSSMYYTYLQMLQTWGICSGRWWWQHWDILLPISFLKWGRLGTVMKILDPRFNIEISLRDPDFIIMIFVSSAGVLDIL